MEEGQRGVHCKGKARAGSGEARPFLERCEETEPESEVHMHWRVLEGSMR